MMRKNERYSQIELAENETELSRKEGLRTIAVPEKVDDNS
jgi:hypothetical protein